MVIVSDNYINKRSTHDLRQKNFKFSNYSLPKHKDHSTINSISFQNLIQQTKYLLEIDLDRSSKEPRKSVVFSIGILVYFISPYIIIQACIKCIDFRKSRWEWISRKISSRCVFSPKIFYSLRSQHYQL